MPIFERRTEMPVSREALYRWHMRPGAFERLAPPWEPVEVEERRGDGVSVGSELTLRTRLGPITTRWQAGILSNTPGEGFVDTQRSGPFARWEHHHLFLDGPTPESSVLHDRVEYELPVGALGQAIAGSYVADRLERMFAWRHERTREDLARHALLPQPLCFAVTGATGLVGRSLLPFLSTGGHRVLRLVRRAAREADERSWDPEAGTIDAEGLEGVDVFIHLAGENVGEGRWTPERKARMVGSREKGTRLIAEAAARLRRRPKALISASAVGFYGDTGQGLVDETSPNGAGFLAEICRRWEEAAEPARQAGLRVVHARIGVVLDRQGGALQKLLPPFSLGLGGPVGSGEQGFPWVSPDDVVYGLHWMAAHETLQGPVNLVAPVQHSQGDFARCLGRALGRPAFTPLPAFAVKAAMGEMGKEILLAGQRVEPGVLRREGYRWHHPTLEQAFAAQGIV